MTMRETAIQCSRLAESNCSNFINGKCQGERSCPVFTSTVNKGLRCPYFEESVLPADSELQEAYSVQVLRQGAKYSSKKCKGCGKIFKTDNYRVKYCGDVCKSISRKNSNRISQRKYAENEKSAIKQGW
ncbi:hypothetical protein GKZ89_08850 [Bacillus mangrovi]|uniref:Cysteine-rich VLP domain-containing protein n=1 Tax=Metabacillus mangrovi TaxID=1491830 RepID=A0A7X2S4T4_9BACI|nr:cysteine-rich VLP protein [Metabacillus mangrovi]MTH53525.1 hypothetical protein [Metabacillus mangrovi]